MFFKLVQLSVFILIFLNFLFHLNKLAAVNLIFLSNYPKSAEEKWKPVPKHEIIQINEVLRIYSLESACDSSYICHVDAFFRSIGACEMI